MVFLKSKDSQLMLMESLILVIYAIYGGDGDNTVDDDGDDVIDGNGDNVIDGDGDDAIDGDGNPGGGGEAIRACDISCSCDWKQPWASKQVSKSEKSMRWKVKR